MDLRAAALGALCLLALGSCGDDYKEGQGTVDAPIVRTERDGWVVMSSPDHFPNIAFRCFGPNGLYNPRTSEADASRQVVVVPNDPQCTSR